MILLAFLALVLPGHHAQPAYSVTHQRARLHYLAQQCYPLDYWHVICPEPAP